MLSATTTLMLSYLCLSMAGMQVTMRVHMDITLGWDLIQVRKASVMVITFVFFYYLAIETTYTSNSAILFANVQCVGNESSLFNCSYSTSLQCPYQRSAIVECLGKKINSVHACGIVYYFYIP